MHPERLTADRLTQLLRHAGVLEEGSVRSVAVETNPAFNSAISHLRVTYGRNASAHAPSALVLKRNLPEQWARDAGEAEVAFYTEVGPRNGGLPMIVPCYDAVFDPATRDSHVLLLDVSTSHEPLVARDDLIALHGVPGQERLDAAVNAVAHLHAYWWENRSLFDGSREVSGWYGTRERFEERIERRRLEWETFLKGPGVDLPVDLVLLYRRVLNRLPVLWDRGLRARVTSGQNLTLVHGDCYLSQFLYPRDDRGTTYLVDWQGAQADLPALDLTHLFATFWTAEQRHARDRERGLLRQYLDVLATAGVVGYTWEQLQWDYRLLLIYMVLHPIWDAVDGASKDYWWPTMQCRASAYRDWRCDELLA